jgi:hypothetical protein
MAVKAVSYTKDDPKNGADITLINLQKMAMPCTIEIVLEDRTVKDIQLPVETWLQSDVHTIHFATNQPIASVTIDPKNLLPDTNRENNVWKQ